MSSPASFTASNNGVPNFEVEKQCIQLYFANLHLIYYFLNKASFMARCESEIWSCDLPVSRPRSDQKCSRFPALYHAVVAVGAITAGDDTFLAQSLENVRSLLDDRSKQLAKPPGNKKPVYPPLELAQIYFAKARALLGDFFEASSLETTQTLFLMVRFRNSSQRIKADRELR